MTSTRKITMVSDQISRLSLVWTLCISLTTADLIRLPMALSKHTPGGEAVMEPGKTYKGQEDNLRGKPGQGYYVEIGVGTPPQKLNVLVDTGSSNFAVASEADPNINKYFQRNESSTFEEQGGMVLVPYIQGNWKGPLGRDLVGMTTLPNVTVTVNIACITSSHQFFINGSNWQGILGMGYAAIARPDASVEPFFDSFVKSGKINNSFSMQLCGTVDTSSSTNTATGGSLSGSFQAGSLIIGGIDKSLYKGEMFYTPIHREWYYEIVMVDFKVNDQSLQLDCKEYNFDKTIVDSGTTNLRLPKKVFDTAVIQIQRNTNLPVQNPPASFWTGEELLCWRVGLVPFGSFPVVTLTLAQGANTTIDLVISPQQYLRAVGDDLDRTAAEDCFKFAIAPSKAGTVLGAVVMEGFYVVFDRENKQMGFAQSTCNVRDKTAPTSMVKQGPTYYNTADCAYTKAPDDQSTMMVVAYVMAGVCGLCMVPLVLLVLQWQWQSCRKNRRQSDKSGLLDGER